MNERDLVYATPHPIISPFQFDQSVVRVFPDMVARSVPGYSLLLSLIGIWAARYVSPHTTVYDLGCSLGAATWSVVHHVPHQQYRVVAVDLSADMIARCHETKSAEAPAIPIDFICADAENVPIADASLVILNLTLQFVPIERRKQLLQKIYAGIRPNGVLLLTEKVVFEDPLQNEIQVELHHDFKRIHGYSDLEIAQKRTALEKVLIPESAEQQIERLRQVGFETVGIWFQAFNFLSIAAIKTE